MEQELIGLAEAAMQLGIPYQNAHRLLLTGALRGQKQGSRWYVRASDVRKVLSERAQEAREDSRLQDG